MKKLYLLFLGVFITLLTFGQDASSEFDYGHVDSNKYINSFFGVEFNVPEGWYVSSNKQKEMITERGRELMSKDNKNLKEALKSSDISSANLFTMFKYEYGAPVNFNPSIIFICENVTAFPGIKTGNDYLFQTHRTFMLSDFHYDHLDSKFKPEKIGGKEFYVMHAEVKKGKLKITQSYYSTVINRYGFNFILSSSNKKEKKELESIIHQITFKR